MKIQTNIRAGAGQKRKSSSDHAPVVVPVPVYYPPVSRCTGI